ncbi:MAG: DUF5076 domain-containing protein [Planctomycetota bacterium]
MHQLFVPIDVGLDPESHELLRAWHSKGQLIVAIDTQAYDSKGVEEGEIWAIMLAQIANDIAGKLAQKYNTPRSLEASEMRKVFLRELENLSKDDSNI